MLDIHQTPDGAILCHNSCTGSAARSPLGVDLQRMVDFLKANPDQFVTVFLEDYIASDVLRVVELASVNGLSDVLYRPDRTACGDERLADDGGSGRRGQAVADLHRPRRERRVRRPHHPEHLRRDVPARVDRGELLVHGRRPRRLRLVLLQPLGHAAQPLTRTRPAFQPAVRHEPLPRRTRSAARPRPTTPSSATAPRSFCTPAARKKPNYLAVDRYELGSPSPLTTVGNLNTYVLTAGQ